MSGFKALCLLHGRDARAAPDAPLLEVLNGDAPLRWRELQRVLQEEIRDEACLHFVRKGRLGAAQRAFADDALAFLRERGDIFCSGIHDDIWHLVWSRGHGAESSIGAPPALFRGHRDHRWRLESTLARPGSAGLQAGMLAQRVHAARRFVEALRARQADFFATRPSDAELVAVAQHFGFATGMLDFTRSLKVAAFFATAGAEPAGDDAVGAIFQLSARQPGSDSADLHASPSLGDFDLFRASSIRFGKLRLIEPALADPDNRIARQQGVFVTDFHPRDFQHILASPIRFRQRPGEVFEDPAANIRHAHLLDDASPLARFAAEVRETLAAEAKGGGAQRWLPSIDDFVLPDAGIFGSNGAALGAVLTDGRHMLNCLPAFIEEFDDAPHIASTLAGVLNDYFAASRTRADVGQQADDAIRPFHEALAQLAHLSQVDAARLWSIAAPHLPAALAAADADQPLLAWQPREPVERLVSGVVLYLAAWECLQFVDGEAARDAVETAVGWLTTQRIAKVFSGR